VVNGVFVSFKSPTISSVQVHLYSSFFKNLSGIPDESKGKGNQTLGRFPLKPWLELNLELDGRMDLRWDSTRDFEYCEIRWCRLSWLGQIKYWNWILCIRLVDKLNWYDRIWCGQESMVRRWLHFHQHRLLDAWAKELLEPLQVGFRQSRWNWHSIKVGQKVKDVTTDRVSGSVYSVQSTTIKSESQLIS